MNFKFNFTKKPMLTRMSLLLLISSFSIVACQKDDWGRGNGNGGKGNGGNGRDTTILKDSIGKDSTIRDDSSGRGDDSSWRSDSCVRRVKSNIDYINITNGTVYDSSKSVSFKIKSNGINTCAKDLYVKETSRRKNGNIVDIYLESEISYSGCICSDALTSLSTDYNLIREPNSNRLTYYLHIVDVYTGTETVNYISY